MIVDTLLLLSAGDVSVELLPALRAAQDAAFDFLPADRAAPPVKQVVDRPDQSRERNQGQKYLDSAGIRGGERVHAPAGSSLIPPLTL